MESIDNFFKMEKDPFYMKGQSIGEAKKCGAFVKNLITKLNLSNEQAVDIAETSVDVVAKIREELEFKE